MNIAIFTPSQDKYSETFIHAHKNYLEGNVYYYYGKGIHIQMEGEKDLISSLQRKWIKVYSLLFKKGKSFLAKKRILHSLQQHKIQVVLVEYGNHAHHVLPFLKESNIPMVVHFHGYDASNYNVIERCQDYTDVFQYASKVVVVSKIMKEMIIDIGCPEHKIVYNVYGPQPEFEKVTPTFRKKQFIAIGRFVDKKAPYYTILAFKQVVTKHPDATLLLAGNGVLYQACKNLIKLYNLENNITLLGIITPETYRKYLSESLAFVQHSIRDDNGDMEGTPLAILEASAAGLPVISTYHAGIPDVIAHENTGLLCQEHDVEAMAKNMIRLLDDVDYAKQLGAAGKKNIQNNFSLKRHIETLQQTIEVAVK